MRIVSQFCLFSGHGNFINIRMAKKFIQVFTYHLMEKSKWTFGPTQSFWQLKPQWARNITTDVQILALPHALRCLKLVSSTFWTFISPAVKLALLNISVVVVCGLNEIDWRESLSNLVTVLTVLEFSLYVSSLLSVTSLGLDFQFPLYFSILPSPNMAGGGGGTGSYLWVQLCSLSRFSSMRQDRQQQGHTVLTFFIYPMNYLLVLVFCFFKRILIFEKFLYHKIIRVLFVLCVIIPFSQIFSFTIWFRGFTRASLVAQAVKHLPTMWETQVWSLSWEDPLEKEMATHSSILAWKIPWTEDPGGLQSMGSQRVGRDFTSL